jgi:hypothetical protein
VGFLVGGDHEYVGSVVDDEVIVLVEEGVGVGLIKRCTENTLQGAC